MLQGGLGTSDQRLRERATEVDAMLRALLRATRAMQSVPELVTRVLVERFDLAPEVAAEMVDETALGFTPDASAAGAERACATRLSSDSVVTDCRAVAYIGWTLAVAANAACGSLCAGADICTADAVRSGADG